MPQLDMKVVRAAIAKIRALDRHATSTNEIFTLLNQALTGYQILAPSIQPGFLFHRARTALPGKPRFVHQLSYPPAESVSAGRAHRAGVPLFYCASAREAALVEVRPKVGEYFAIGTWTNTLDLDVNHVGFSIDVFKALGSANKEGSWSSNEVEHPGGPAHKEVNDLLAELFSEVIEPGDEHKYVLTQGIAELMMNGPFDGLQYPTIQMQANAQNFAVRPSFVDRGLAFQRALFGYVTEVSGPDLKMIIVDTADGADANGELLWAGISNVAWAVEPRAAVRGVYEDGKWVWRDAQDHVVEHLRGLTRRCSGRRSAPLMLSVSQTGRACFERLDTGEKSGAQRARTFGAPARR